MNLRKHFDIPDDVCTFGDKPVSISGRAESNLAFGAAVAFDGDNREVVLDWAKLNLPGVTFCQLKDDIVLWIELRGFESKSDADHLDLTRAVWNYLDYQIAVRQGTRVKPNGFLFDIDADIVTLGRGAITPAVLPDRDGADVYEGTSMTDLLKQKFKVEWIIKNLWPVKEPGVCAGASKALKTSILMDAAISIATGTLFLKQFECERRQVRFISGESGHVALQNLASRICHERKIPKKIDNLIVSDLLPRFPSDKDLARLARTIQREKIEVLILDPLYKCGLADAASKGLYGMGEPLYAFSKVCSDYGVSSTCAHHFTKYASKNFDPPTLQDMQESGVEQWARWWWLVKRRERYCANVPHELWFDAGGSLGHSSLWHLSADEGPFNADGLRTRWQTNIVDAYLAEGLAEGERVKREGEEIEQDKSAVLLKLSKGAMTKTALVKELKIRRGRLYIVDDLLGSGKLVEVMEAGHHKQPNRKLPVLKVA